MSVRKWENVKDGDLQKVYLYNHMIDTAINNGYGTPRIVYPLGKPPPKTARQEKKQ